MTKLDCIRAFLSNIPFINQGGCAYAALAMYRVGKSSGSNIKMLYAYDDIEAFYINGAFMRGDTNEPATCTHAFVHVDDLFMDCKRSFEVLPSYERYHYVTEDLVVKSLSSSGWRNLFDKGWAGTIDYKTNCIIKSIDYEKEISLNPVIPNDLFRFEEFFSSTG